MSKLDADELLRHEIARAEDVAGLLEFVKSLETLRLGDQQTPKPTSTDSFASIEGSVLEAKYREEWRISRESNIPLLSIHQGLEEEAIAMLGKHGARFYPKQRAQATGAGP